MDERGERAEPVGGPRAAGGGCLREVRPMRPTSSSTSSTRVTSTAPSRIIRWQPADRPEVTGPGTAITGRPSARASAAVRWAPLRSPASTTTVPAARPAMSRLRTRNRCRAGTDPGGYSRHDHARAGDPVEQRLVRRGIAAVDPAGQHGDRRAARGERSAMGGAVDADRGAGDHREPRRRQPGAELARDVHAVAGGRPGPDDRGRLVAELVQRARPADPQRDGRRQVARAGRTSALPDLGATTAHRSPDRHLHRRASRHPHHRPRRPSPHPTRCGRNAAAASRAAMNGLSRDIP